MSAGAHYWNGERWEGDPGDPLAAGISYWPCRCENKADAEEIADEHDPEAPHVR